MIGVTAFEMGNAAATLLILRATDLLAPGRSQTAATQLALVLYVLYNLAATLISIPAGRHGDRSNPSGSSPRGGVLRRRVRRVRGRPRQPGCWRPGSCWPGSASAAARPPKRGRRCPGPDQLRGSAFGLLATIQAIANLAASALAGVLWTAVSPAAAFGFLAAAMIIAVPLVLASRRRVAR